MNIEEYLKILTEQIRCKAAREPVQDEIRCHIEDQKEAFLQEGMNEMEAEIAAVKEMGDPIETGIALDGIHRPKMAWGMILGIVGLSLVGFVLQVSMKANGIEITYPNQSLKFLIFLLIGLVVMIGICYFDYTRIARYAKILFCALAAVMFFGAIIFSRTVNGLNMYVFVFGIAFNIKILVLLFVPLYAAILYQYRGESYGALLKGVLWMLPVLLITMNIPSVSTTLMMFLILTFLLLFAVYKDWFLVSKEKVFPAATGILFLLPILIYGWIMRFGLDYIKERLQAYIQLILNPESRAADIGYQTMAIRTALEGSKMVGESADSLVHMQSIPEVNNYVLTYVVTYYGILAGIIIIGAILFLLYRMFHVSLHQKNQLGMMMGAGCCAAFFVQILFYVLSNLGFTVLGGGYCPFIAYGGSGMIMSYALLGVLLSIYRYQNVVPVNGYMNKRAPFRIHLVVEKENE